ncbi:MAG: hypothetical protein HWN80_08105 [Candidatus Lokiarchaeota archaeon]|nr:hypothetical protein [Candidatus Lokiarchaeota archaeon]
MVNRDTHSDLDKAWEHYEKIRDSLNGLYEILNMNLDDGNIFYKCAVDNLEILKETIIDLLKKDYNPTEIKIKLRELEFDMKKHLFFESEEKQK